MGALVKDSEGMPGSHDAEGDAPEQLGKVLVDPGGGPVVGDVEGDAR